MKTRQGASIPGNVHPANLLDQSLLKGNGIERVLISREGAAEKKVERFAAVEVREHAQNEAFKLTLSDDPDFATGFNREVISLTEDADKYGKFVFLNALEKVIFVPHDHAEVHALARGKTKILEYLLTTRSGVRVIFTVVLKGENDASTLEATSLTIKQGAGQASVDLGVKDQDLGESRMHAVQRFKTALGEYDVTENGVLTYRPDRQADAFTSWRAGDPPLVDRFEVVSFDGTRHTFNATILPDERPPVLHSELFRVPSGVGANNVVFVVDVSGSMNQKINGQQLLQLIKEKIYQLIAQYEDAANGNTLNSIFNLVLFNGETYTPVNAWGYSDGVRDVLKNGHLERLLHTEGQTYYQHSLQRVMDLFANKEQLIPDGHNVVHFLSDGKAYDSPLSPEQQQVWNAWRQDNGVKVFISGVGEGLRESDRVNIQAIGEHHVLQNVQEAVELLLSGNPHRISHRGTLGNGAGPLRSLSVMGQHYVFGVDAAGLPVLEQGELQDHGQLEGGILTLHGKQGVLQINVMTGDVAFAQSENASGPLALSYRVTRGDGVEVAGILQAEQVVFPAGNGNERTYTFDTGKALVLGRDVVDDFISGDDSKGHRIDGATGYNILYGGNKGDELINGVFMHGKGGDDKLVANKQGRWLLDGSWLVGGKGNDELHGGEGKDIFAWYNDDLIREGHDKLENDYVPDNLIESGNYRDKVIDFDVLKDQLNFRDVVQKKSAVDFKAHPEKLSDYFGVEKVKNIDGSVDTRILVQDSLERIHNDWNPVLRQEVVLKDVDLFHEYGLDGATSQQLLEKMVEHHSLIV